MGAEYARLECSLWRLRTTNKHMITNTHIETKTNTDIDTETNLQACHPRKYGKTICRGFGFRGRAEKHFKAFTCRIWRNTLARDTLARD